ncbi:MAG: carboxypeptidase regulatory-like domain-containing protein [Ignavibacteriae bacterium]|nr:carboxypeptidase regulatory-like domain-containing protein [Ignavibacteriota bacterium]
MNKILLTILLLAILPGLAGSGDKGVLRGSVRSMETRELLEQTAIVFFHMADTVRERTVISHSGLFVVLDMPPGTYRARVAHEGYHAFMSPVFHVKADSALSLNFFLKPFVVTGDTLGTVRIGKPGVDYKMKIVRPESGTYR